MSTGLLNFRRRIDRLNVSILVKFIFVIEILALLGLTVVISRDYQDSWILTGLEIPFIIFIFTYILYFYSESNITWVALFAVIVRSVILLIPNLKYVWFQGAGDQVTHYLLFQDIYENGYVPSGYVYSGTPFLHILFTIFSKITGSSVLSTFKYLPVITWLIYPLIIYVIIKSLAPNNPLLLKYAIFISSIPIKPSISYLITGTYYGVLLVIILFSQYIRVLELKNRNYWIITILLNFVLIFAHSYSSIIMSVGLIITYFVLNSDFIKSRFQLRVKMTIFPFFLFVLSAAWISNVSTDLFFKGTKIINNWINALSGLSIRGAPTTGFYLNLFKLNFVNIVKIVLVYNGGDLFMLFLTTLGIMIAIIKFRSSKSLILASMYLLSIWSFYVIHLLLSSMKAGFLEYNRIFSHSLVFTPIFIGTLLYYLHKTFHQKKFNILIISLLIIFSTIELYRCQPLIPTARSVRPNLPSDEPITYVGNVNSLYQRQIIMHAEKYIDDGMIACDLLTERQILMLTDNNFSNNHLLYYYPFSRLIDKSITEKEYEYILIHTPGKSGVIWETPEIGTIIFIHNALDNASLIYSNGESYILTKPFMYSSNQTIRILW